MKGVGLVEDIMSEEDCLSYLASLFLQSDSSEDEEVACWKAALRQHVEEDLERQVRLRLGLGLQGPNEKTKAEESSQIIFSHPYHTRHPNSTPHELESQAIHRHEQHTSSPRDEEDRRGSRVMETEKERVQREETKKVRKSEQSSGKLLGDKLELFCYLNRYHGPPLKQLKQLSRQGAYKTKQAAVVEGRQNDSIHWPVEANIFLPTPHHITSHEAQAAASLLHQQSFGGPSGVENCGLPAQQRMEEGAQQRKEEGGWCREEREYRMNKERGRVVYECSKQSVKEEMTRKGGDGLVFESQFEGGNLHGARQMGPHDYMLVLNSDLYTKRHVQWYYFRVTNMKTTPTYTFHILNFEKKDSLYSHGMQPLLYSERDASSIGMGWRRVGWNVTYHQSRIHYPPMSPDHTYFTLSWSMQFPHHDDTCYLAHCYPYPLSALYRLLGKIERDTERAKHVQREELCRTLAGNVCPLLTITSQRGGEEDGEGGRRGVVVTARVHPGETNSSWMMEGLLSFLTSDTPHAQALRKFFVFKVVPMLNPDGVVVGNYRTSLAGVDLNRIYKAPIEELFPTVYHTKKMIERFQKEREVCVYIDLHGHSRKQNVFMYGCHATQADHTHFLHERLLPFLLSQQAPRKFSFASCKFAVHKYKEATGRVVTWRMGVPNSFTLEATFCGSNLGPVSWQFNESDLLEMGRDLGEALYSFSKCIRSKTYQEKMMAQLAETLMEALATPTDPAPTQLATLPDIITSTTSHISHNHPSQPSHLSHSRPRKHAQLSLHKFMKLDMDHLEQESSTSGSDSDNEDFRFKWKKCSKQRNHRRRRSLLPYGHTDSPHITKSQTHQLTLPSLLEQATPIHYYKRASAPARLQSMHTLVNNGSKWRFVNRYTNRSNGGIPMFAEERLKERKEKRLRSVSEVVHLPPAPAHPSMAANRGHTHHATLTQRPHPHWSRQTYCHIPPIPDKLLPNKSPRQQHYQQIKGLVEQTQLLTYHHPSHITPSQPPHLPSHLISYISEVWNK